MSLPFRAADVIAASTVGLFALGQAALGGFGWVVLYTLLVMAMVGAALIASRAPFLAGVILWVVGAAIIWWRELPFAFAPAVLWVVYAAARYGGWFTVAASLASMPLGLGMLANSGASTMLGALARTLASIEPAWIGGVTTLVGSLAALIAPWAIGLLLRFGDRRERDLQRLAEAEALQQSTERARRVAELEERRQTLKASEEAAQAQLARDVHDVVGHSLAVILAQAEAAQYQSDVGELHAAMANIAGSSRRSLREIRELLGRVRDGAPANQAPDGGLEALIASVQASGAPIQVRHEGQPGPMPPELEFVAYRVLQEMLTNALRHGRRDQPITVNFTWADRLKLEVRNAVGGETTARLDGLRSTGIPGIRKRLAAVGGSFEFDRFPGPDGDVVTATAWVPRRATEWRP